MHIDSNQPGRRYESSGIVLFDYRWTLNPSITTQYFAPVNLRVMPHPAEIYPSVFRYRLTMRQLQFLQVWFTRSHDRGCPDIDDLNFRRCF
jgi:hypothetical protein